MCTANTWPSRDGLRIGYLNTNHVINKLDEISSILYNSGKEFHLFCCAESRLTNHISDADVSIPGYNTVRLDPNLPKQTGLILYISQSVTYKRIYSFEKYCVESIWIEVNLKKSKPLFVGFLYRNPSELTDWFDRFSEMMEAVTLIGNESILLGDFNIDLLKSNNRWTQIYSNFGLFQLVDTPTRITSSSKTLIDHIYVSSKQNILEVCSPLCGCSDHSPVCLTWLKKGTKIPKPCHKVITYRSFTHFDKDLFLFDLAQSSLSNIYQFTDPDEAFEFWHRTFTEVYNKHAPFKIKRVKHTPKPPWYTDDIKEAANVRDTFLRTKQFEDFQKQRNKVTTMLRSSRKRYFRNLVHNGSNSNSNLIWKAINILTKKGYDKTTSGIKDVSADDLNYHFANISNTTVTNDRSHLNDLILLKNYCDSRNITSDLDIPSMTVYDVYYYLTHLKQTGTRGLDDLDGKILKLSAPVITDSLTYLYNLCIDKCYFPNIFKRAKIIPLFKSGEKTCPSNYRPISIMSVLSKPLEKHVYKHLMSHISKHSLLHPGQSGFRENHSCHTTLTNLVDEWLININENKLTGALFVDFAKAFDVIDHSLLLRKLALYRLSVSAYTLIKSFLSNRQHCVLQNNVQSCFLTQNVGVPQGSVLGPLLFSLYINDLPLFITKGSCELFADDTSIHSCHSDLNRLSITLQDNVNQLINWTELNHMSLNDKKTKLMLITSRQKRQNITFGMPPIHIGNKQIDEVDNHKVLGVTIDNNLSWSPHIDVLSKRVSQKVFQLSKIKKFLDVNARKQFYHSYIQSYIDYASTLYDLCSANSLKPLIRVHKRALKVVLLKSSSLTSRDYISLDILPLTYKLEYNKAVMMYRIMNGLAPPSLIAKFPLNQSKYTNSIIIRKPRIDMFKTSLSFSGGILWNSLEFFTSIPQK
eukprot:TRINITY_DN5647_c0_g1_i9.p1 TRINITY_DN5647_c0_g1~~TRINITY_DN5647_c0_g1_i9.p1  ORF type:complete len:921 (+),score=13.12 TRINITY_DN5647_c0_g1_i9:226-2988(+)